jgi:hypothetical protein
VLSSAVELVNTDIQAHVKHTLATWPSAPLPVSANPHSFHAARTFSTPSHRARCTSRLSAAHPAATLLAAATRAARLPQAVAIPCRSGARLLHRHDHRFHRAVRAGVQRIDYETPIEGREPPGRVKDGPRSLRRVGSGPCRVWLRTSCRWKRTDRSAVLWCLGSCVPRLMALRAIGLYPCVLLRCAWLLARWEVACSMSLRSCIVLTCCCCVRCEVGTGPCEI